MSAQISSIPEAAAAPEPTRVPARVSARQLARARWACRALFLGLGLLAGVWGVHVPSVKSHHGLGEMALSAVLFSIAVGAVTSLFFAGRVVARWGVRRAAVGAGLVMTAMLGLTLQWPSLPWLLPTMVAFGAAMSLYDVAINSEGTVLESLGGRPIMGNLHGTFSLGGMAGAALASLMLRLQVAPAVQMAAVGVCVWAGVLVATRFMLEAHPEDPPGPDGAAEGRAHFAWPRGPLLLIGALIFCGMTAEGVMMDWCVLYLKQELAVPQAQAGLGFAAFSAAMAVGRFGGDALRARFSEPRLMQAGALMAAVAMAVTLGVARPAVALVGYALVGLGLALVVPILFTAATRVPAVSRAAAIAAVSSVGYTGFVIGPPVIGAVAQGVSLTAAMGLVVVAAGALALGARRVR